MPIGLKIEMQDFSDKKISFAKIVEGEEPEYFELPVIKLELEMVPGDPPVASVKFLVSDLAATVDGVRLAEVAGVSWKLYCIFCKKELVRSRWQIDDGSWRAVWLCECEVPEDCVGS